MKVLLIFPPITHEEIYSKGISSIGHTLPPLGLAYIAAVLEENGVEVKIIDAVASNLNVKELTEQAYRYKPDWIGISSMTPTINISTAVAVACKTVLPETPIVLGGAHASMYPVETLQMNDSIDFAVFGEGEFTMLELINSPDIADIEGLAYRNGSVVKKNPPRPFIENLDELPFPARHLLPMDLYSSGVSLSKRKPQATMITSRGCIFHCSFCSKSIFGRDYRVRSPENVVAEIEQLIKDYGVKEISFWDDIWGLKRSWAVEMCNLLIEKDLDLTWSCETRVNLVDLEMLKLMKKAGCWNIFYGIESGNQDLLDIINKGITLEQSRNAVKWTKQAGIEVRANFMLALPGETPEKAMKTIEFAKELDADFVKFNITTPYPDTELYKTAKTYGTLEESLDKFTNYFPVFVPSGYDSKEEILEMRAKAYKEYYFRWRFIFERLFKIRSFGEFVRHIRGMRAVMTEGD
jgi:radical SAM superfamily enzyme YgiQ (UPF0313 family)